MSGGWKPLRRMWMRNEGKLCTHEMGAMSGCREHGSLPGLSEAAPLTLPTKIPYLHFSKIVL